MRVLPKLLTTAVRSTALRAGLVLAILGSLFIAAVGPAEAAGPVTTCTLGALPNPAYSGQSVRFRFFANNEPTVPGPIGLVSFFADLDPVPFDVVPLIPDALLEDHSTAFASKAFPIGSHTVRAILTPGPTSTPCPSIPAAGVTVLPNPTPVATTTTVSSGKNPTFFGERFQLEATVTRADGLPPVGAVLFRVGGTPVGTDDVNAQGSAVLSQFLFVNRTGTVDAGQRSVTAEFISAVPDALSSTGSVAGGQTIKSAPTTTLLTVEPSSPLAGTFFTLKAQVVGPGGPKGSVEFSANGIAAGTVALDESGAASLPQFSFVSGVFSLTATFVPSDGNTLQSTATRSLTISSKALQIEYTGDSVYDASPPVMRAKVTEQGTNTPVGFRDVTFSAGGAQCTGRTDATGTATCTLTPTAAPGNYTGTAAFAGDGIYMPATRDFPFSVNFEPVRLEYTGDTSGSNQPMQMKAVATSVRSGRPIAGLDLSFSLGDAGCSASTSSLGEASCVLTPTLPPGDYYGLVNYPGSPTYAPSTLAYPVRVVAPTTTTTTTTTTTVPPTTTTTTSTTTVPPTTTTSTTTTTTVPPTAVSIVPSSASPCGDTRVQIQGSRLAGTTQVTVDGQSVPFQVSGDGARAIVVVTVPPHAPGTVAIVARGPSGSSAAAFTYRSGPGFGRVTLSPERGPEVGGTSVTVRTEDQICARSITIDGVAVPFTQTGRTSLRFVTPPHPAGRSTVTITAWNGTRNAAFDYLATPKPTIRLVTPTRTSQNGGTVVTLVGRSLVGATAVTFDGVSVAFQVSSIGDRGDDVITFTAPSHDPGSVQVKVSTPVGSSDPVTLTVFAARPPRILLVTPSSLPTSGGTLTIVGEEFGGVTSVTVDGVPVSFTLGSSPGDFGLGRLRVTAPPHAAGPAEVRVTTPAGTSRPVTITYRSPRTG